MPPPLPTRFRYGFFMGGCSLAVVFFLWFTSRSNGSLAVPAPAAPSANLAELAKPADDPARVASGAFSRGASLGAVLQRESIGAPEAHEIGLALKKVLDPRDLRSGDRYKIVRSPAGGFESLVITRGLKEYGVEKSGPDKLTAFSRDIPLTAEERSRGGRLEASLWESMRAEDLTAELIMGFSDIFQWNIDFLTECRPGDRFALAWEHQSTADGEVAGRKIIAALYDGKQTGRQVAILFNGDFYDEKGRSMRRAFLSAPLQFRRISSGFSLRRFHPILRYFRPHLGIDYAAPTGTPVSSIGDGTVIYKGWKGAFGNYVEVRHNGTYTTCYGHFSRYAKGLRVGSKVKQGQVIGYVGSTGHSTGPHLDFRVRQNGRYINFLKLKIPPDRSVPAAYKTQFTELAHRRLKQLEAMLPPNAPDGNRVASGLPQNR
jgi:murein DD-endopeptidase MepM/ murein hydrolase activator NlpD